MPRVSYRCAFLACRLQPSEAALTRLGVGLFRWLHALVPAFSLSPTPWVGVSLYKTACAGLGHYCPTVLIALIQPFALWRTGALRPVRVVHSTGHALLGERTLVSAFLLSREWYIPVSYPWQSGPPHSLLSTGWQTLLLSRPQLPLDFSGSQSTSCLLLSKSTSATQPWPGLSPQICSVLSFLFSVCPSSPWSRHSTIFLTARRCLLSWQLCRVPCPVFPGTTLLRFRHCCLCSPLQCMPFPLPSLSWVSQLAPCPSATWLLGSTLRLVCLLVSPASPCPPPIPWSADQTPWHDFHPILSIFQTVGWPTSGLCWIPPRFRSFSSSEWVDLHFLLPAYVCLWYFCSMRQLSLLCTTGPSISC